MANCVPFSVVKFASPVKVIVPLPGVPEPPVAMIDESYPAPDPAAKPDE